MRRYILLLGLLFLLTPLFSFAGEGLRYKELPTGVDCNNYYQSGEWIKVLSKQDNQVVKKINIFLYTLNGGIDGRIEKYDSNDNLVATFTLNVFVNPPYEEYAWWRTFTIYPYITLNNGEYLKINIIPPSYWSWSCIPQQDSYDIFNYQYFDVKILKNWFGWIKANAEIYVETPDNPIIHDVNFETSTQVWSSNIREVFTSSTPLIFYVDNLTKPGLFRISYKDNYLKEWITIFQVDLSNVVSFDENHTSHTFAIRLDKEEPQLYISGNICHPRFPPGNDDCYGSYLLGLEYWAGITPDMDFFAYGKTLFKIEVEQKVNQYVSLPGEYIFITPFPPPALFQQERFQVLLESALGEREVIEGNKNITFSNGDLSITFMPSSLSSDAFYSIEYVVKNSQNEIEKYGYFRDVRNEITDYFSLPPDIYTIDITFYKNGTPLKIYNITLDLSNSTSYIQNFRNFYSQIITKFGFPSTTTPTPIHQNKGLAITRIFYFPTLRKISIDTENVATKIADAINQVIATIKSIPFIPGWLILAVFFIYIFIVGYNLLKRFFLR